MSNHLPEEIIEAIMHEVVLADLEFYDNFRAYRHKDNMFKKEYDEAYDWGCCGFFDTDYTDTNGDVWTIGCNYGH